MQLMAATNRRRPHASKLAHANFAGFGDTDPSEIPLRIVRMFEIFFNFNVYSGTLLAPGGAQKIFF